MLSIVPVPAFNDNYIWILENQGQVIAVDPGDARPVLDYCAQNNCTLTEIWITHHHGDHTGGISGLLAHYPALVRGPANESIPACEQKLAEGHQITLPLIESPIRILDIPGHTAGHIAYFLTDETDTPWLFCGDTLFAAGCGRLFEGTPQQMHESLSKLASLPGNTRVCCAHEYTLSNLKFAMAVEPNNEALALWQKEAESLRAEGKPTLPSTLDKEKATNPFLRTHIQTVAGAASRHLGREVTEPVAVFAAIRQWKDKF